MKTTLDIDDTLLRRAKARALERGTTLRSIVEEALQRSLGVSTAREQALKILTWPPSPSRPIDDNRLLAAIKLDRHTGRPAPEGLVTAPPPGRPVRGKKAP